jgi:hypothetical protein
MGYTDQKESADRLRRAFPVGSTVHITLKHVSRSGMSRSITVIGPDFRNLSHEVARVIGWRFDRNRMAIVVDGAGMDRGFHLVYTLARCLYGPTWGYSLSHEWI